VVTAGIVAAIHVLFSFETANTWMRGTSPRMTKEEECKRS
jgi:hypothetical protein